MRARRSMATIAKCVLEEEEKYAGSVANGKPSRVILPPQVTVDQFVSNNMPWEIEPTPHLSSCDVRDGFELSIAPMMKVTDYHYHFLMRQFTRRTRLYTEMIVDDTILYQLQNLRQFLGYNRSTHPLTVQLGGNDPGKLAKVAAICEEWGFEEIDLNVGCPSSRVSGRCFGARLMLHPEVVRDCCAAMRAAVRIPVTVKCRLGADDVDTYEDLANFINVVNDSGVKHYIIHARKCILDGLSTHENRTIPPLMYDRVYRIAEDFPENDFSINGGILTLADALGHRVPLAADAAGGAWGVGDRKTKLRGVMIGRGAWHNPWAFADADRVIYGGKNPGLSRRQAIENYLEYGEHYITHVAPASEKNPTQRLLRPLTYLFTGVPGGKQWRHRLNQSSNIKKLGEFRLIVEDALQLIPDKVLDETFPVV